MGSSPKLGIGCVARNTLRVSDVLVIEALGALVYMHAFKAWMLHYMQGAYLSALHANIAWR